MSNETQGWRPVSDPPPVHADNSNWCTGELTSDCVLVVYRQGGRTLARYVVDDDASEEPLWRSACSEEWDITKDVLYWHPLPSVEGLEGVKS